VCHANLWGPGRCIAEELVDGDVLCLDHHLGLENGGHRSTCLDDVTGLLVSPSPDEVVAAVAALQAERCVLSASGARGAQPLIEGPVEGHKVRFEIDCRVGRAARGWAHPPCRHLKIQLLAAALALLSRWRLSKTLRFGARCAGGEQQRRPTSQAAKLWARPSCRHFKIQSCCCLGSAFEVAAFQTLCGGGTTRATPLLVY
jgi:hypothetical protein